jgi:hypothetical protein
MILLLKKIYAMLPGCIPAVCIFFIFPGCRQPVINNVTAFPGNFKVQLPFHNDSKGIIIATYWGSAKKGYNLYLDNHSPTWTNDNVIRNNVSISKSKDFLYRTTTADGTVIEGDVYICDSINLGSVRFANVPFYNISNKTNEGKTDGAIGENIMSRGIWKIDFKNNLLTIASSIDSIEELQKARLLPAVFTTKAIEIEVSFSNATRKKIELDLGYNGCIIMPSQEFTSVIGHNKKRSTASRQFSTPAGSTTIEDVAAIDSIKVGNQSFRTFISTNRLIKEKLIGRNFFYQFDFIIIDYVNKAVYVSKKSDAVLQYH